MPRRRDVLTMALAALSAPAVASSRADAQTRFPDRPIRLVIPFAPGGVMDAGGRPWAEKMKSLLGTVIVENIGGAGGAIGANIVARAQPDGYTLLIGSGGPLVVNPVAASRTPYDPVKDFEPIFILVVTALTFVVHPSLPVHNLKELIDYAKANPGKLSYGSAGVGSFNHLTGELFKSLTGTDIAHVPYRGASFAITDVISGQIPMATPNMTGQVLELHNTGKLRIIAVTTPKRVIGAPEFPTAIESGIPGLISQNFVGLFAPAGTPRAITDQISQATRTALGERDLQQLFIASGFEPQLDSSPERTRQFLAEEIARWTPVIKSIGLKFD